jgi:hypothetical protein
MSTGRVLIVNHSTSPSEPARPHRSKVLVAGALAALFLFRLLFGLSSEFFFEDETQIFLIGFRYFATGEWPYFGPDVVWTESVIPGALQGLLVGLPMTIVAIPEAPFVLLNLLSFGALAWLAWYIIKRLPGAPRWLVWGWLMTIPWTLQFSTHVTNPSYVLPAAIVFFIGFLEAMPMFRLGVVPRWLAFACMGAAVTWVMQIHMSWPLMLPYLAVALAASLWRRRAAALLDVGAFVLGALVPALSLMPTFVVYGAQGGTGGTLRNLQFEIVTPEVFVQTLARFFSFASLEIARFIETDGAKRLTFFQDHLWLVPFAVVVWAVGIVQPFWMMREWFRSRPEIPEWVPLRVLVASTVLLVYVSYWFVTQPAQAHAFYLVSPVAFVFVVYCWMAIDSPRWRTIAAVVLAVNLVFHAGLAIAQAPARSLYKNREAVAAAVRAKEPEMFAHRRPFAIGGGPKALANVPGGYHAPRDLVLGGVSHEVGALGLVIWRGSIRNTNPRVAFRDVLYYASYLDGNGRVLERRHEFIENILQPGEVLTFELNDGFVRVPFTRARFEIAAAEALLPIESADDSESAAGRRR